MELIKIFNNFLSIAAIIVAVFYSINFSKSGKAYKVFSCYLIFIAGIQILLVVYSFYKENNLFLFNYYFIGQFLFMSLFYFYLLKKRWIWKLTGIVMLGLLLQYIFSPTSFINYNIIGVSITQSVIVVYALLYYYRSLSGEAKFLYVNTGVFFYFISSILFFSALNLISKLQMPKETHLYVGLVNDFLYFTYLVLIFIEWYKNFRFKKI